MLREGRCFSCKVKKRTPPGSSGKTGVPAETGSRARLPGGCIVSPRSEMRVDALFACLVYLHHLHQILRCFLRKSVVVPMSQVKTSN